MSVDQRWKGQVLWRYFFGVYGEAGGWTIAYSLVNIVQQRSPQDEVLVVRDESGILGDGGQP